MRGGSVSEPWRGYGYYVGQLVMSSTPRVHSIGSVCPVEALDACHEDENGRLPHEAGYVRRTA